MWSPQLSPQLSTPPGSGRRAASSVSANTVDLPAAVWRADQLARQRRRSWPTGFAALDAALPGGGWPMAGLVELLLPHPGVGELALLAPALSHALAQDGRGTLWVAPPWPLCAHGLLQSGLDLQGLTLVHPTRPADAWWATEAALKAGTCVVVLLWCPVRTPGVQITQALRRLHLAAQSADALVIALREEPAAATASPAPLRLACHALPGRRLSVRIVKRQGPACDIPLHLQLPDHALDRPAPALAEPGSLRLVRSP